MAENGALWRFFEGQERHFFVLRAGCARLQDAHLPGLTFTECSWLARRLRRQIDSEAPFFTGRGTKRHMEDRVDLTIEPILLRARRIPRPQGAALGCPVAPLQGVETATAQHHNLCVGLVWLHGPRRSS